MRSTIKPVYTIIVPSSVHCNQFRQDFRGFFNGYDSVGYLQNGKRQPTVLDKEWLIAYSPCL